MSAYKIATIYLFLLVSACHFVVNKTDISDMENDISIEVKMPASANFNSEAKVTRIFSETIGGIKQCHENCKYHLTVKITYNTTQSGISSEGFYASSTISVTANYVLFKNENGKRIKILDGNETDNGTFLNSMTKMLSEYTIEASTFESIVKSIANKISNDILQM